MIFLQNCPTMCCESRRTMKTSSQRWALVGTSLRCGTMNREEFEASLKCEEPPNSFEASMGWLMRLALKLKPTAAKSQILSHITTLHGRAEQSLQ
jgi:hypothetical protein